jgi:uncharacterized protein YraI
MSTRNVVTFTVAGLLGALTLPSIAMAASMAIATHNVNVRAGPDTGYPVVDVARAGDRVYVYGCLDYRSWCDVDYDGLRGWINSNYLAFYDRGRRYVGSDAMHRMRPPIITFHFDRYWDRHYRDRRFYRERERWERPNPGRPPRLDDLRPYADEPMVEPQPEPRRQRRGELQIRPY